MGRRLATIQKISKLEPIIGMIEGELKEASAIELASFENIAWRCVVKKGEFEVGDLVVYIEVSTVLPESNPVFSFMKNHGYRVRTAKFLKTTLSQGLVLPLSVLPISDTNVVYLGEDVTDLLGVTRYEPPASIRGEVKGVFPDRIPKTDQIRIQSFPQLLDELKGYETIYTLKCDGTSVTFYLIDGEFGVCSRNLDMKQGNTVYWKMAEKYGIETILRNINYGNGVVALQAEIVGPGIQKNRMGLQLAEIRVFDFFRDGVYAPYLELSVLCNEYGLPIVPVIKEQEVFSGTVEDLLEEARGTYPGTNNAREGLVIRPKNDFVWSQTLGGRLSFKVVNNDYALAEGE